MSDPKANVKKVKAYPIESQIKTSTGDAPAKIVKLTFQGFLAEIGIGTLKPGEPISFAFELPVLRQTVTGQGIVVKIYNQWGGQSPSGAQVQPSAPATPGAASAPGDAKPAILHLIEVHFHGIGDVNLTKIRSFLESLSKAAKQP